MNGFEFARLYDIYGGLLTATQREIASMRYDLDLSLQEIAEEKGITRQAVSECLKTCAAQLLNYEQKLRCLERGKQFAQQILSVAEEMKRDNPEFSVYADKLNAIINKR